jgi:hypothetical protein
VKEPTALQTAPTHCKQHQIMFQLHMGVLLLLVLLVTN